MRKENEMIEAREDILEGRNPVFEALRAGREIDKILIAKSDNKGALTRIIALAKEKKVIISEVERRKLDQISRTGAHQGIIAYAAEVKYVSVSDILGAAKSKGENPLVVICDNLNDAGNLGAIIRSAECCGAHGVIIPKHRSVGINAIAAKASAGAIEHIPICKVTNLTNCIKELKKEGLWIFGTDAAGKTALYDADLTCPAAVVIGSEGEGMSRLVAENCDFLLNIPLRGSLNSLNASNAAAIVLYEALRQRIK